MKWKWVSLLLAAGLLTAGCGMSALPDNLVKAPRLAQTQQAVTEAVMQALPEGAKLTVPSRPLPMSAVNMKDLNGDGQDDAVAFYKKESSEFELGILVLENEAGKWKQIANVEALGRELDYADFQDVTGDNLPELLVGLSGGAGLNSEISVYSLTGDHLKQIWRQKYSEIAVGDLTGDDRPEIAVLLHDHDKLESKLKLYGYRDGEIKPVSELDMDGGINGFDQALIGSASPTVKGLFVDMGVGAHSAFTSLVIMKDGKLTDVFGKTEYGGDKTFKPYMLHSEDVNGDGIVEIGIQSQPVGSEELPMVEVPWINSWYQWDGSDGLKLVEEDYADYDVGFGFTIPAKWRDAYTVEKVQSGVRFSYIGLSPERPAELLSLKWYSREDWKKQEETLKKKQVRYTVLGDNGEHVITAQLPADAPGLSGRFLSEYKQMLLQDHEVQNHFRMVEP
ncbi:hypothetical protein [Brevibacillus massiliensis]|uniref:hypothetical protein n=1 Tax=Brevibacillus massiliensis TaxID=1118054 RepID=UPI000474DB2F|nr:hypothetical protein [Brevibacillus massiliensis]